MKLATIRTIHQARYFAFQLDTSPSDLLERILEDRFTRVPIYEESIDDVLGTVHLKDLVKLVGSQGEDLLTILKPCHGCWN